MDLSVVIPLYNEAENIRPLYERNAAVLPKLGTYEIIFVDDGSNDGTWQQITALHRKDKHVRGMKLRRNFGQTAAMDAGFHAAQGKIIVAMDGDLQNDPADIPRLLAEIGQGYDVVSGWRYPRRDPLMKRFFSRGADKLRRWITGEKIHDSGCSLKAYRRECFADLELYGEMHRFIPALLLWKGFKIGEIKVTHHPRLHGKSKYTITRLGKGFLDLLVVKFWMQYSARPIHLFGGLGLMTFFLGFLSGVYLTYQKFVLHQSIAGRPLLMLTVLLLVLGVQFIIFGLMSDILIKVYFTGKNKSYSIEKIVG
ncbi:MAG TPA: glycosyltransferase family 2 protein [Candidatus Nanoarchaeia archaeon]|nr:glycosyltransferase family 2 protein [Candidatus Nanoarchaeia archaeon]